MFQTFRRRGALSPVGRPDREIGLLVAWRSAPPALASHQGCSERLSTARPSAQWRGTAWGSEPEPADPRERRLSVLIPVSRHIGMARAVARIDFSPGRPFRGLHLVASVCAPRDLRADPGWVGSGASAPSPSPTETVDHFVLRAPIGSVPPPFTPLDVARVPSPRAARSNPNPCSELCQACGRAYTRRAMLGRSSPSGSDRRRGVPRARLGRTVSHR